MAILKTALVERQALVSELESDNNIVKLTGEDSGKIQSPQHKSKNSEQAQLEIFHLKGLITFIEEEFVSHVRKMDALNDDITFDLLWRLFPQGSEIVFKEPHSSCECIGKVAF